MFQAVLAALGYRKEVTVNVGSPLGFVSRLTGDLTACDWGPNVKGFTVRSGNDVISFPTSSVTRVDVTDRGINIWIHIDFVAPKEDHDCPF